MHFERPSLLNIFEISFKCFNIENKEINKHETKKLNN